MVSTRRRLALLGACIASLLLAAAFFGSSGSASAGPNRAGDRSTSRSDAAVPARPTALSPRIGTQRGTLRDTPNAATSKAAGASPHAVRTHLRAPTGGNVVLWDQYNNDLDNGIVSAVRTDDSTLSAQAADDFIVPAGGDWTVNELDIKSPLGFPAPSSFNVHFWTDNAGLPGTLVSEQSGLAVTGNPDYVITLSPGVTLGPGTYWVTAEGVIAGSNWYWEGRNATFPGTQATAWRNPGDGYATGCTDWAPLGR